MTQVRRGRADSLLDQITGIDSHPACPLLVMTRATFCLSIVCVFLLGNSARAGVITWDAGGDGVSLYQEDNWTAIDGDAGTNPPADTINANSPLTVDLLVPFGTPGGPSGAGPNLDLGGRRMTLQGGTTRMNGSFGINGNGGFIDLSNDSSLLTRFITESTVSLGDESTLLFYGGDRPVVDTTIELLSLDAIVFFNNETPEDFLSEHLSKFTVFGAPAENGVNIRVTTFNGELGSQVQALTVPEPASALLYAFLSVGCLLRRRRI